MAINFDNYIFNTIDRFTFKSGVGADIYFLAEDLQNFKLTNGEETVYGTGKAGRRISAIKRNKTAGISFDNGFVSMSQMSAQTGSDITVADTTATILSPYVDVIKAGTGGTSAATTYKAEGTAGAEIKLIYKRNSDGSQGDKYVQAATASATEFSYAPETKALTLPTGIFAEGDELILTYEYKTKGKQLANSGDTFSKNGMGILEATVTSACDKETIYYARFIFNDLAASGQYEIGLGGDQTINSFTAESLPNFCRGGSFWNFIIPIED